MRYATIIEKMLNNYSAYVPDLPGCIATGSTIGKILVEIQAAISLLFIANRLIKKLNRCFPDRSS
jgi:predicted RNase H-like HicB family nuclease